MTRLKLIHKIHPIVQLISVCFVILLIFWENISISAAQQSTQWAPQAQIPGYADDTVPPFMVADQNKTVHAFTSEWIGEGDIDLGEKQRVIYYSKWTKADGWSDPIDVILPPKRGQAFVQGVFLDPKGLIHLMFVSGDDTEAGVYHVTAPATDAGRATAWSKPQLLDEKTIMPVNAAMAADDQGNFFITYNGNREGVGIYSVNSSDGGKTWSDPTVLFLTYSDELLPYGLDMDLGESGQVYAVWNIVNERGANVSGHFATLDINKREWSTPIEFAQSEGLGIANPTVIEHDNEVFIAYNNGVPNQVPPTNLIIHSTNKGQTWDNPVRIAPHHVGRNGLISLVVDSNDILHAFFGLRTIPENGPDVHGMWHSYWTDNHWSDMEPVISGPQKQGKNGFDPYDARAVVVQGNVILVTWRTDPGQGTSGPMFSYLTLDTPESPVEALPTVQPTLTATPFVTPTSNSPEPTSTPRIQFTDIKSDSVDQNGFMSSPSSPLIISMGSLVVFIAVTIGIYNFVNNRHY